MTKTPIQTTAGSRRRLQMTALSLLLIIAGAVLIVLDVDKLEYFHGLSNWPTTEGTIVVSEVIGERAFRPHLIYEYEIEGVPYTDSSFLDMPSFGGRRSRHDAAEKKAEAYPVGKTVAIHYNPDQPTESRIKIHAPWSVYGQLGFAGFLVILGLVAGFFALRRRPTFAPTDSTDAK